MALFEGERFSGGGHHGFQIQSNRFPARRGNASRVFHNKEQEMRDVMSKVQRFVVSEDGPTAVEYAVMLGLIVVAIVGVVGSLAKSVSGTFSTVSSSLGSS
jgi:pilus assembly protein Flp/PilA